MPLAQTLFGGTAILMRMGKRRSAVVIISRGFPGISLFLVRSTDLSRPLGAAQRLGLAGLVGYFLGMPSDCYACRLTDGTEPLPGGRIYATKSWVVEHCTGPLGVGTLIVKPFRHCLHVGDLTAEEAQEIGPLLQRISQAVRAVTQADQVYVCSWSHMGWQPVHIHFVVQPAWNCWREAYDHPGPFVQAAMFQAANAPPRSEVQEVCREVKRLLEQSA